MGSHKKAESSVLVPVEETDDNTIKEVPLSLFMTLKFGKTLPYLFKILSISKCLSIQAHPGLELAAELHDKDPEHYPDSNHKPEMAIALSPFKAFSNFAPADTIIANLSRYPNFVKTIEEPLSTLKENIGNTDTYSQKLKELFLAVHKTSEEQIEALVQEAKALINGGDGNVRDQQVVELHN